MILYSGFTFLGHPNVSVFQHDDRTHHKHISEEMEKDCLPMYVFIQHTNKNLANGVVTVILCVYVRMQTCFCLLPLSLRRGTRWN